MPCIGTVAFERVERWLSGRCEFFLQRERRYQALAAGLAGGVADVESVEWALTSACDVRGVVWNRLTC